jgi:hypothetical protein
MHAWLKKHFPRIDREVSRFADWATALGILAVALVAAMTWAASSISDLAQHGWGAVVFAGLGMACLIVLSISAGAIAWRWFYPLPTQQDSELYLPTVTTSPPTLQAGLYVSDVRFTFADLAKDRHSELTMRAFNGTGRVVEFSSVSGQIKFNAPNNTNPAQMGTLPTPSLHPEMARVGFPLQEWFLMLSQRVPAAEADKLLTMLESDTPIQLLLNELKIEVFAQDERNKIERIKLWHGVSYKKEHGFGQIISAVVNITT